MARGETSAFSRWVRAARDALAAWPHKDKSLRRILSGLDAAHERADDPEPFDLATGRMIIFSDHHRGQRDGADDFRRCERAYRSALGHYLEAGHTLVLLGDVEELWENVLPKPLEAYQDVLALERRFAGQGAGGLRRFYGNHDLVWSHPRIVEEHERLLGGPLDVREGLRLDVRDGDRSLGELFLTHGHQGTPNSDLWAPFAMLPVRYVWPVIQRSVNFASTSPARDYELRGRHDQAMFEWARRRGERGDPIVLVTGHTHKPVFRRRKASGGLPDGSPAPTPAEARAALDAARAEGRPAEELSRLHALLEFVATQDFGAPPREVKPPCYFNTGCCSFADGDVTGLEIIDGRIRLVRWLDNEGLPAPKILDDCPLTDIFDEVAAAGRGGRRAGGLAGVR